MKHILLLYISIVIIGFYSCEKSDDEIDTNEDNNTSSVDMNYIIVSDITTEDILFIDFEPDLEFGDSIDIDSNSVYDLHFLIDDIGTRNYEMCMEDCASAPPDEICDCFQTWEYNFLIHVNENIELSYDSAAAFYPRTYSLFDTISKEDIWIKKEHHLLIYQDPDYYRSNFTDNSVNYLGFRYLMENDTLYGWIDIYFHFQSQYKIQAIAIQNKNN